MITKYVIKDMISNQYTRWAGRGDTTLYLSLTPELEQANTYCKIGPATAFINQYEQLVQRPHSMNPNRPPPQVELVVVEIGVEYREMP
jgi:hypothetical protein